MNRYELISIAFLVALAIPPSIALWIALRRESEYTVWERMLFGPVYCLGRILWRVEGVGVKCFATAFPGGAVIVANHRCSLDPFFLQMVAGRRVHWMVAGEYFRNPIFGPILRVFQAIPTNRSGADNAALKTAIRLASDGRYVGMFPEGRINRTPQPLHRIRPGAAMVAAKAGVPMIPCWIEGAPRGWAVWSGFFMPAHVRVLVGRPILPDGNASRPAEEQICLAMQTALSMGGYSTYKVEHAGVRSRRLRGPVQ